jgi:hypothetical protein
MTRPLAVTLLLLLAFAQPLAAAAGGAPAREQDVLDCLGDMAAWHQRIVSAEPGDADPGEVLFRDAVSRTSRQALDLAFEYARAEAARLDAGNAGPRPAGPATAATAPPPARGRRMGAGHPLCPLSL